MREVAPSRIAAAGVRKDGSSTTAMPASAPMTRALDPLRRGTLLHGLLQALPEAASGEEERMARRYLEARARDLPETEQRTLADEALAVRRLPELAALFGATSRAEVDIIGTLRRGTETVLVEGRIDRLAVLPDRVLLADFKTDAVPPASPEAIAPAYLAQLAAYRDLLAQTYRDRPIETLLVFTAGPAAMRVPDALLDAAAGHAEASEAA